MKSGIFNTWTLIFFCYIKVLTSNINFQRGESTTISIEQTVPLACTEVTIVGFGPFSYSTFATLEPCRFSLRVVDEPTLTVCGSCTTITGFQSEADYLARKNSWGSQRSIKICHKDDGVIEQSDDTYNIRLQSSFLPRNNVWSRAYSASTQVSDFHQ